MAPAHDPRRQLSVPTQPTHRSSPPQAALAASARYGAASPDPEARRHAQPTRKASMPMAARSTHPLQVEIERLTKACEEHERVIRSSLSTLKHHLIYNVPEVFEALSKCDDDAEAISAAIQRTLQDHIPSFQSQLGKTVSDRTKDVDLMRHRTTPWRDVVKEQGASPPRTEGSRGERSAGVHKLKRVNGVDGGETDALTKVEMWADEVDMYLSAEIVRAKERLADKTSKRRFLSRVISFLVLLAIALLAGWFVFEVVRKIAHVMEGRGHRPTFGF
ncbi:hypothetical protein IAU60_003823 [Kwoniella sp. DSM 27419]